MQTKHDVTVTHGWHDNTYLPIQPPSAPLTNEIPLFVFSLYVIGKGAFTRPWDSRGPVSAMVWRHNRTFTFC